MRKVATIIAIVACAHGMVWMLDNRRETPPAIAGKLASLSYNAAAAKQDAVAYRRAAIGSSGQSFRRAA